MNQFTSSFSRQCFSCKKFGHKATECKSQVRMINQVMMNRFNEGRMNLFFNGYCYTYKKIEHKENQCRSRSNGGQTNKKSVVYYNCNKPGHISKVCKIKKGKQSALVEKNEPVKKIDKEEMNKIWKNKEEEPKTVDVSVPSSSTNNSSRN